MELPSLKGWKRHAAYGAFFLLAFLLALQLTFPSEAVQERILLEAAAQGWQVHMADIQPAGFGGVRATGVTLESRDGLRLPIEEARASFRLWPLLLGRQGFSFQASLFRGRVRGVAEQGRGWQRLALEADGVDLAQAVPLRKATGLDLAGTVGADLDVTLDARDPAKSKGHIDVSVDRAVVNGGEVPVPGMGGNLTLPRFALGTVTAKATVKDGKATFERLGAKSDDVEIGADQLYVAMQPRLEYAPLYGRARVKLADAFWQKSGTQGLRGIVEVALASAKGRDGSYGFQIYGSLGHPQARPAAQ